MNFPLLILAISLIASGTSCTIQKDIDEKEAEKREQPFYDAVNGVVGYARDNNLMWRKITLWASFVYYTVKVGAEVFAACGKCMSDKKEPDGNCQSSSEGLVQNLGMTILTGGLVFLGNSRRSNTVSIKHDLSTIVVGSMMLVKLLYP